MKNEDCKMARGLKTVFGIFFGFMAFGLAMIGITYLPVIGIFLSLIFFVISGLLLISPRDAACYVTR